jgi:hypothetical protein
MVSFKAHSCETATPGKFELKTSLKPSQACLARNCHAAPRTRAFVLIYQSAHEAGESGTRSPPGWTREQTGRKARQKKTRSSLQRRGPEGPHDSKLFDSLKWPNRLSRWTSTHRRDTAKWQRKPASAPQRPPMAGTLAAQRSRPATSKHRGSKRKAGQRRALKSTRAVRAGKIRSFCTPV